MHNTRICMGFAIKSGVEIVVLHVSPGVAHVEREEWASRVNRGQTGGRATSAFLFPFRVSFSDFFGKILVKVATSFLLSDLFAKGAGGTRCGEPISLVRTHLVSTMPSKNSFFPQLKSLLLPSFDNVSAPSLFPLPRWICVIADRLSPPLRYVNARVRAY